MKDISYYKNTVAYPTAPRKPTLKTGPAASEARRYADLMDVYEADMIIYREALAVYNKRNAELHAEFKADLIENAGLTGHPKTELLFSKAWDHGHAQGYGSVEYWFNDLAELVA